MYWQGGGGMKALVFIDTSMLVLIGEINMTWEGVDRGDVWLVTRLEAVMNISWYQRNNHMINAML